MSPAAECTGCLKKWVTKHEPAESSEIEGLINAASDHTNEQSYNYALDLSLMTSQGMLEAGTGRKPDKPHKPNALHTIKFTYYEHTPSEGFEDAKVVV